MALRLKAYSSQLGYSFVSCTKANTCDTLLDSLNAMYNWPTRAEHSRHRYIDIY